MQVTPWGHLTLTWGIRHIKEGGRDPYGGVWVSRPRGRPRRRCQHPCSMAHYISWHTLLHLLVLDQWERWLNGPLTLERGQGCQDWRCWLDWIPAWAGGMCVAQHLQPQCVCGAWGPLCLQSPLRMLPAYPWCLCMMPMHCIPLCLLPLLCLGHPRCQRLAGWMLRSCGLNARLVQKYWGKYLKEMKESLLIIKTTEWQTGVKRLKSFRFTGVWEYKRETKSSLGLNFW